MWAGALLAAGAVIVIYVLAAYPFLLWTGVWRKGPPVRKDPARRPSVSVVMPVYNGGRFIRAKIESLLDMDYPRELLEILVVSDGSTDETDAIAESFAAQGVRLLRIPHKGKAASVNIGLANSTGEIVFFNDVRQQIHPDALAHLTANFADSSVGVVTGELRYLSPPPIGEQADMQLYWEYELWARRKHCEIDSMFAATGCIYAVRRNLAEPIPEDTLADDAVIPLRAFFRGYRIIFEPRALAFDYRTAEGAEFRRRLRTLAGLWQVYTRMPELFSGGNRMRVHFFSHKLGRLVLPWAILLVAGATVALPPSNLQTVLLGAYAAVAAVAALDWLLPRRSPLKRVTSPPRTFLVMNAAALLSVGVFFIPAWRLWQTTQVEVER